MAAIETPTLNARSLRSSKNSRELDALPGDVLEPLKLLAGREKLFTSKIIGVPLEQFSNPGNLPQNQLKQIGDSLRELFYTNSPKLAQYDQIIDRSLAPYIDEDPDSYGALANPEFATAAKRLVRGGMYCEIRQHMADRARADLHFARNGRNVAVGGLRQAASSKDFIVFNHDVRDFVNSSMGRKLGLDRETSRKALKILLLGDSENATGLERGIALEIATKRLMDKMLNAKFGDGAVVFGTHEQDRQAGDLILFPETPKQTYVDVKYSAPNKLRQRLSDEAIRQPGFEIEQPGRAVLWLGSEEGIGNNYGVPGDFVTTTQKMVQAVTVAA